MAGRTVERPVRTAVSHQRWEHLTFLHWRLPPDAVAALLPPGLEPHTFDGDAWLGVTPFAMHARAAFTPRLPHLSHFTEVNVRTYVRAPDGTDGLWFFTLECPRLPVVAALRAVGVPYTLADTDLRRAPGRLAVRTRRPGSGVGMRARVEVGEPVDPDPLTDHLTGRWSAYIWRFGRLWRVDVDHEPWPLHQAEAEAEVNDLVVAHGLPALRGAPLVHHSPGVRVRIGPPRPAGHNGPHG